MTPTLLHYETLYTFKIVKSSQVIIGHPIQMSYIIGRLMPSAITLAIRGGYPEPYYYT